MTRVPLREKVVLFFTFVVFLFLLFLKYEYSPDDAFIYLKYSRNLAEGSGFSFNAGEPSYGVTSLIWAVFLSMPYVFGINALYFAKFSDLVFFFASLWIFYRLTYYFFKDIRVRILALCVFIINPWLIRSVFTGMETSLAVFAVLLVFLLYYSDRHYWSFVVAAFSFFIRPETMALLIVLTAVFIIEKNIKNRENLKLLIKSIGLASFIIIPLLLYAYFTFGTAVPNTVSGKAAVFLDYGKILSYVRNQLMVFGLIQPLEVIFASAGLFVIIKSRDRRFIMPVLWIGGLIVLYFFTGASVMARYFLIVYPFMILLGFKFTSSLRIYLIYGIVILFFLYSQLIFFSYVKPYCHNFTSGIRECLIPIGKWIENNTPPGSRVLVNDVGAIGYSTTRYIIDAAALINRDRNLNRKILSVPVYEKENPHFMLEFIETDYLIEKKSDPEPLKKAGSFSLEFLGRWVFPQMWVFDPNPQYFFVYKVIR